MNAHPDHPDSLPDDLRPIEAALADLARWERAAAPARLESRLAGLVPTPLGTAGAHPVLRIQPRRFSLPRLRIAAALVLVAALAAVITLRTPAPAPTPGNGTLYAMAELEDDVDLWLSFRTADEFQVISDRIDLLAVDADALSNPFSQDWTALFEPDAM
jgi:hypothetical protein